jgi:LCP family protein required for cell wall assembly
MDYRSLDQKFEKVLYWTPEFEKRRIVIRSLITVLLILTLSASSLFVVFQKYNIGLASLISREVLTLKNTQSRLSKSPIPPAEEKGLTPLKRSKDEKINILLVGVPGEPWPAPYLTDSIEVISIDNKNKKIFIIALPRDLLVRIPNSNLETRINVLYSIDNNPKILQERIKEITGLETQYYGVIDLQTIEKIIDVLGGIDVKVKEDIYDSAFPTISRGYETFSIKSGLRHLDGKTAIKYIRSRHQPRGDFGRIERQQQVMEAIREKVAKLNLLSDLPKILAIFNEVKSKTDINIKEIKTLTTIAEGVNENVEYFLIDAGRENSLLAYEETVLGGRTASVLWPKKGKFDYSEIKEEIAKQTQN